MSETKFVNRIKRRVPFLSPDPSNTESARAMLDDPFTPEHRLRRDRFNLLWRYYLGHQKPALVKKPKQPDFNVRENITKQIVNDSVNFLFGGNVAFETDGTDTETAEEQAVREYWKPRVGWNPGQFLTELGQTGTITGTAFVRLYPAENGNHRLVALDSGNIDVVLDPNDIETVLQYHVIWFNGQYWTRDRIGREAYGAPWTIDAERYVSKDNWVSLGETEQWPYDFAPIMHCKNLPLARSFWGMSDIDAAELNDAVNRTSSDVNKILAYYASPWQMIYGITPGQLKQAAVEMGTDRMLALPETARAEVLEMASQLNGARDYKDELKSAYSAESDSVRLDPMKVNFGSLSGFAINLLYLPLILKTYKKQAQYGDLLSQINHALLVIGGMGDPAYVRTKFTVPLPQNENEMVDRAVKLSGTYSAEGAARVAGFDANQTDQLMTGLTGEVLQ